MAEKYAHPEALVETDWVAAHANDAGVRLIEVDVDTSAYDQGHLSGSACWNWQTQLQDQVRRTLASKTQFEDLCSEAGLTPETTVILYGDNNNWFAAWAFWQFKYYGHPDVRLMNGGRKKWILETRPLTLEKPFMARTSYKAKDPDHAIRAFRDQVMGVLTTPEKYNLVDVRSVDEYTGMDTWFVLKYLLGYRDVRNYDGSWTEWGNLIEAPIERTAGVNPPAEVCR